MPHDVVARRNDEHFLRERRVGEIRRRNLELEARPSGLRRAPPRSTPGGGPSARRAAGAGPGRACATSLDEARPRRMTSSIALPIAIASGLPPKVVPCTPTVRPRAASAVARQRRHRKAAADALGGGRECRARRRNAHRRKACPVRPTPVCTSSKISSRPRPSQISRKPRRNAGGTDPHAALALDRLDHDRGRLRPDRRLDRVEVGDRNLVEAVDLGAEPFEIFRLAARGDGRQRAAVERALEGEHAVALRARRRSDWRRRAILIAASFASAPELVKKTRSAKVASARRRAKRSPSGFW